MADMSPHCDYLSLTKSSIHMSSSVLQSSVSYDTSESAVERGITVLCSPSVAAALSDYMHDSLIVTCRVWRTRYKSTMSRGRDPSASPTASNRVSKSYNLPDMFGSPCCLLSRKVVSESPLLDCPNRQNTAA